MAKRLFPKEGTQAYEQAISMVQQGRLNELRTLLGYSNISSLKRTLNYMGISFAQALISELPDTLTPLESKVLGIVKSKPVSVGEISRQIDRSSETVIKTLDSLRHKHFNVELDEVSRLVDIPHEPKKNFEATEFDYFRNFYRIGLVSDTHLGSKYQQLTALYDAYSIFDVRDVDFILHSGDLADGMGMYREHHQESFLHDSKEQLNYAVDNYPLPQKKGLKTYVIGGQHDRSFYKQNGYDLLEHICERREDLIYRGFFSGEFQVKGLPIRLEHPGGGLAYARSYSPQKIVENMMGYINTLPKAIKPILLVMGHWHTPLHLPVYMGVDSITLPCFQAQTPYMQQRKNMMPTIGCAIAEVYLNEEAQLSSIKVEFIIMNDRVKEKDW